MSILSQCAVVRFLCSAAVGAMLLVTSPTAFAAARVMDDNPIILGPPLSPKAQVRPFSIEDVLARREIDAVRPAPSGDRIALTIGRPIGGGELYPPENRMLNVSVGGRNDLLVLNAVTGGVLLDTRSRDELRSVHAPVWSPDGRQLAFFGIGRDSRTRLYIWESGTGLISAHVIPPVRQRLPLRGADGVATDAGLVWTDDDALAFVAAPDMPDPLSARATAWRATEAGEPSVRVWSTDAPATCRPDDALVSIAADTGTMLTLASGPIKGAAFAPGGDTAIVITAEPQMSLAPAGRLAFPPQANLSDYQKRAPWRADIVQTADGSRISWLADEEGPVSTDSLPAWSRDGARFYAVTRRGYVTANGPADLITRDEAAGEGGRRHFAALHSAELAGDLYLLGRAIPKGFELPINPGPNFAREPRTRIEDLSPEQRQGLPDGGEGLPKRRLPPPAPAEGAAFDGFAGDAAIFHADTPDGTFLWSVAQDGAARVLLSTNTSFAQVASPAYRTVPYAVGDAARSGLLYLPTNYPVAGRLRLVVTAYPGFSAPRPRLANANLFYEWQLRLLLANGFAVFVVDFRAFPKDGDGVLTERIMREMTPAIAAAKSLPEIDPDRVGYYGHSYGGVTGLTVLGRSHDFAAAVISAPVADLLRYGLSARPEVADLACSPSATLDLQELQDADGFLSLNGPMTDHVEDYLRQSPIWTAGDITTPVLMIRGELDGFNGADELFAALAEKGVEAELAVYAAEPHNLASPGNIRDAGTRILAWFRTYLPASPSRRLSDGSGRAAQP